MDGSLSAWLLIAVALAAANLPFLTESVFGVIPVKGGVKSGWLRILELIVLYFVTGGVGYLLEARMGTVFGQVKEFYMLTVPLFLVLAFPGFVLRYLRKHHP
jgi:hypothetical protein